MHTAEKHIADCLVEGSKAMKSAERWKKFGDAFRLIGPIRKLAYEQAALEAHYAQIQFEMADLFRRLYDLEKDE